MKSNHYECVHFSVERKDGNLRVEARASYGYDNKPIGVFFVPENSIDRFGMLPEKILSARMKHDFRVVYDHYTYTTVPKKT